MSLVRETSALIDPSRPAYDVALEEFEKGMTSARIDEIFTQVSSKDSASGMPVTVVLITSAWQCIACEVRKRHPS